MKDRLERVRDLVFFLCSAECGGRAPGSDGIRRAQERIVAELDDAGAQPAGDDGWFQRVPPHGRNVLARVPGSVGERTILVAAHHDHLGTLDGDVYPGADDNAAAVAVLCDVARALATRASPLGGDVLVASFDQEEPPYFLTDSMGSVHFVANPTVPLGSLDAMICLDLVGHAKGPASAPERVRQSLFALGAELSDGMGALVDRATGAVSGVVPWRVDLDVIPPLSDYHAFREAGVPVLFLTCGRWEHYHRPTDTPDRLDFPKVLATADLVRELVVELSSCAEPLAFREGARDDSTTLATLEELGGLVASFLPELEAMRPQLERLREAASRGALGPSDRQQLTVLLGALESLLARP